MKVRLWEMAALLCALALIGAMVLSRFASAVAVFSSQSKAENVVVIDAGHGGEDGGAVSVSGLRESDFNLEISLRLNDFLHFLGIETKMIRTEDVSVSTEGQTVAQRKVSDIRNRVKTVEQTDPALLVSIHQNFFSQSQYRGAQIFYADTQGSAELAESMQRIIAEQVDPSNHRQTKAAQDIYLMEHVSCTAVLVECGFLSNYDEEQLLRTAEYQKKLTVAVGCCIFRYLEGQNEV